MSKKLSEYEDYDGPDASLDISLYEYGIIWKCTNKRTKEYHIIYGVGADANTGNYTKFDSAHMKIREFRELLKESWFDKKGFDSFRGSIEVNFPDDLHSALQYYGCENIFGSSYYPFEIKEDE